MKILNILLFQLDRLHYSWWAIFFFKYICLMNKIQYPVNTTDNMVILSPISLLEQLTFVSCSLICKKSTHSKTPTYNAMTSFFNSIKIFSLRENLPSFSP